MTLRLEQGLRVEVQSALNHVSDFLRWWIGELLSLLPASWRARLAAAPEQLRLQLHEETLRLYLLSAEGERELGRFRPDGDGYAALSRCLQARQRGRPLVFEIAGKFGLARDLVVPAAAQENLRQVLTYEMDRYTPFSAEAVYFGFRSLVLDRESQSLRVRLAVVPRAFLDRWLDELRSLRVHPDRIEVVNAPGVGVLPAGRRGGSRSGVPGIRSLLVGAVLLLLMLSLMLPIWKLREVAVQLGRDVADVQQQATRAGEIRQELDRLLERSRYLLDKRQERPAVVSVLDELARVLPDHTWVQSFQLQGGRGVIQGYSTSASGLIGQIEASPMFGSVGFMAPVTRHGATETQVFQIGFTVEGGSR